MRRRDKLHRRAFLDGFRAGLRQRERAVREVIDAEFKKFEDRCEQEQKHLAEMLAASDRRALHRLQAVEDAFAGEPAPRWLQ